MIYPRLLTLLAAVTLVAACSTEDRPGPSPHPTYGDLLPVVSGSASGAVSLDPTRVQGAWWTWASSAPAGKNPVQDKTGAFCDDNQPQDVWFLAGTFGGAVVQRRCSLPAGRTLVAPLINLVSEDPSDCLAFMADATGEMTLDGTPQPILRWPGSEITWQAVSGNPVTDRGGTFVGHGCGLWASAGPLAPGQHTVTIRGSSGTFSVDADYELTVTGTA